MLNRTECVSIKLPAPHVLAGRRKPNEGQKAIKQHGFFYARHFYHGGLCGKGSPFASSFNWFSTPHSLPPDNVEITSGGFSSFEGKITS